MPALAPLSTAQGENTEIVRATAVAFPPPKRAVLVVVGPGRRGIWELDGKDVVIGRDTGCRVAIPADQAASRRHARIRARQGARGTVPELEIEDLGSLNGTFVDDAAIEGPTRLHDHARIQIGNTVFKFMLRDEEELAAERELLALATQDALTGLLNRGAFDQQLAVEFERARRYGRPLALVMVDVDYFKGINDRYGHVTGDRVLSAVGQQLKSGLRGCDYAGRYGGEEMAMILPETALEGAWLAAERVRASIESMVVHDPGVVLRVTVSAGVAVLTDAHADVNALIASADAAMYQAKRQGRNRTCTAAS